MSDYEEIVVAPPKKARSKAQQAATDNMLRAIKAKREALAKEKEETPIVTPSWKAEEPKLRIKIPKVAPPPVPRNSVSQSSVVKTDFHFPVVEKQQEQPNYLTVNEFANFLDMVGNRDKKKKTRTVIVEEESESEEEEVEIIRQRKPKPAVAVPQKKRAPVYREPIEREQQQYDPPLLTQSVEGRQELRSNNQPPPMLSRSSGSYVMDRLLGRRL